MAKSRRWFSTRPVAIDQGIAETSLCQSLLARSPPHVEHKRGIAHEAGGRVASLAAPGVSQIGIGGRAGLVQPVMQPADPGLAAELQRHWLMLAPGVAHGTDLAALIEAHCSYRVTVVEDAAEVRRVAEAPGSPIDGVLVDGGPTETEGARLCRQLRRRGVRIPLMLMGDWSNLHAVLAGLESGANDFMPRDCSPNLIATRMRCHLRNHDGSEHATFPIGGLRFHPAGRTLFEPAGVRRVRLTEPESRMLQCLLTKGGAAVPRATLASQVWRQPTPGNGLLDPVLKRLQGKIASTIGRVLPQRTGSGAYHLALIG